MGFAIPAVLEKDMDGRVRTHRFRYHLVAGFVTPQDRVLELGCGTGYGSAILAEVAKKVMAVDIDENNIRHCEENFSRKNIEFACDDVEKMKLPECDVACAMEVLEHLYEPDKVINKLKKRVKKYIVLSVPVGQELIWREGEWQEKGDSTHHSAFQGPDTLRALFIDKTWKEFHIWQEGVTCLAVFYNNDNICEE